MLILYLCSCFIVFCWILEGWANESEFVLSFVDDLGDVLFVTAFWPFFFLVWGICLPIVYGCAKLMNLYDKWKALHR